MNRKHDFYPQALVIAQELYAHKTRFGGARPYIEHPLMLVEILRAHGFEDDTLLCGALLHDSIEENDHEQSVISHLERDCPALVLGLIVEVTDTPGLEREARRKEQIQRAAGYSKNAALVRLADKLANMRDILFNPPGWSTKLILKYCDFAMQVVNVCRYAGPTIADECEDTFMQVRHRYGTSKSLDALTQSPS